MLPSSSSTTTYFRWSNSRRVKVLCLFLLIKHPIIVVPVIVPVVGYWLRFTSVFLNGFFFCCCHNTKNARVKPGLCFFQFTLSVKVVSTRVVSIVSESTTETLSATLLVLSALWPPHAVQMINIAKAKNNFFISF